jgi:hypothetical protein
MRKLLTVSLAGAALLLGAGSAHAGTWYVNPTTINETTDDITPIQAGISGGGDWTAQPQIDTPLPPGDEPGDNGNQDTWGYKAPNLLEGADAAVAYAMPDGSYFNAFVQDDYNGAPSYELASPTCVLSSPGAPTNYSCAATFGNTSVPSGGYDPDPSNFAPYFNFRDNYANPPSGARMATVTAAGQTCNDELAPGQSSDCTVGQPPMAGFSPTDPNNFELLQFVNRGSTPVTVTDRNPPVEALLQSAPKVCFFRNEFDPPPNDGCDTYTPTTCTMQFWGDTCNLVTWGGANGVWKAWGGGEELLPAAGSDAISITPADGAPSGDNWYGVQVFAQAEAGQAPLVAESPEQLLIDFMDTYGAVVDGWSYGIIDRDASISPAQTLAPGRSIASGPYRLTMRTNGAAVEDVSVNGSRYPVWSSGTQAPGARLALQRDGNLVVRSKAGRALWSSRTHGTPAGKLTLQRDGNLVLRSRGRSHRALFATGRVGFPFPAPHGAKALTRDLGLLPNAELRARGARLKMRRDGNLVLYRGGAARWSSRTGGHPGAYAHMRTDGNLVVADPHGKVLWSSRTHASHAAATLRADGRLAISTPPHRAVWTSPVSR